METRFLSAGLRIFTRLELPKLVYSFAKCRKQVLPMFHLRRNLFAVAGRRV